MGLVEIASKRARGFEDTLLVAYLDRNDERAKWTLGTGFNFEREGAAAALALAGVRHADVMSEIESSKRLGLARLKRGGRIIRTTRNPVVTESQAATLLDNDVAESIADLRTFVATFDVLPLEAELVLTDMRFNMGPTAMRGFQRHTIPAIERGDYEEAARCIEASDYARFDVPKRAAANVAMLRRLVPKA